jgi:hypothetical protein
VFWTLLENQIHTWYYASPTMHGAILDAGEDEGLLDKGFKLRMIANAAGGLLPSLAERMRKAFQANVSTVRECPVDDVTVSVRCLLGVCLSPDQ